MEQAGEEGTSTMEGQMESGREDLRVAFQGEPGAFSTEAAWRLLGDGIRLVPCETFERMFRVTESGEADCCLAPIENSLYGSVYQNYDLLLKHDLRIVGEVCLRIVHNLIGVPGTKVEEIERVYSHPVALGQCLEFFVRHPGIRPIADADTAGSVRKLMETREAGAAAIAGSRAAAVYGAEVLITGIEDNRQNYTRFLLLKPAERVDEVPDGADKTTIVFSLENHTGSLYRAMAVFALRDIDLSRIESRPIHGRPWEYSFYLDFLGNTAEVRVQNALAHLAEFASGIRVLGCYRHAPPPDSPISTI